jgi:tetratricopeptide (TPR) repeat protein
MGLLDDAMGEFRAAMGDDARRLDCLQMLGLCSLERECGEEAVAHFQQALALDGLGDDQLLALRFELGRAFEHVGEVAQAREAWEAVVAANASFCDVAERLAGLEDLDKPEAAPEVEADTSPTESYESFEDLMGEVEAEDEEPAEEAHVDFDDLVAEANAEDDDDASQADGTADAESHQEFQDLLNEFAADPEESPVEVDAIDESEPAPAPDAEPLIEPEPKPVKPPRKKKKISFV